MGILGCLINYIIGILVGINFHVVFFASLYDNYITALAFQFLLVKFTIINPLEKNGVSIKEKFNKLVMAISLINFIVFFILYSYPLFDVVIYSASTILFLILCKPKFEKQQEIIEKNIREYYEKNN